MARAIDLDQLLQYPLRRGSEHCDEENADPHFLNGVESVLEWAQTLPTLTSPNEWVSVEEKLPPPKQNVLAYSTRSGIAEADYADGVWMQYRWSAVMESVTHWMPLPEPPTKVENNT